jgi:hypothetical protein
MGECAWREEGVCPKLQPALLRVFGQAISNLLRGRETGRHALPPPPSYNHCQHAHHTNPSIKICDAHWEGVAHTLNHPLFLHTPWVWVKSDLRAPPSPPAHAALQRDNEVCMKAKIELLSCWPRAKIFSLRQSWVRCMCLSEILQLLTLHVFEQRYHFKRATTYIRRHHHIK